MEKINYVGLLFAVFVIFIVGCTSITTSEMMEKDHMVNGEEGFEMIDGSMFIVNEKTKTQMAMEKDAMLSDGTKVQKDGTVVRKDGTTFSLEEGQSIWMDGQFMKEEQMMSEEGKEGSAKELGYNGKVLAGSEITKYLEFTKADYDKALMEKKKIVLYFYANWCPSCRAEQPNTFAAFNKINDPDLIGFRVNYRDSDTDADEEALAKEFGVGYQHTKIILREGKVVVKSPDSWDEQRYVEEIAKI